MLNPWKRLGEWIETFRRMNKNMRSFWFIRLDVFFNLKINTSNTIHVLDALFRLERRRLFLSCMVFYVFLHFV